LLFIIMGTTKSRFRIFQQFFAGKGQDAGSPTSKPPYLLAYRSSTGFIVFTICLAIFTDILFYGLIVPVIPFSLTVQAGVAEDQVQQWTAILLACYNITLFIGSPLVGFYADNTTSRRFPLLLGLFALAGSTLLLCLGKTIALLLVGRLLQGLSAAIVWSVGLALLADTMGRKIGYAMGYVGISMSVGLLIAPVIGGAVYAAAGYYAVYYIAFAVIFCDIVLRLVLIEKKVARQWITDEDAAPVADSGPEASQSNVSESEKTVGASDMLTRDVERQTAAGLVPDGKADSKDSSTLPAEGQAQNAPTREVRRHPHWELIKSKRILAALFGSVIEAGVM
jgi:MFS family permease